MLFVVGSGLSSLPPRLLRFAGDALAPFVPPLRTLMRCVDVMHFSAVDIWEAKKASLAAGDTMLTESVREEADLLSVLRTQTPDHTLARTLMTCCSIQ